MKLASGAKSTENRVSTYESGKFVQFFGEVGFEHHKLTGALILNASYEPIQVISWQKAILLWFQDRVDVLDYHATQVHSVTRSFQLPSVLKLKRFINLRETNVVKLTRQNVFLRDDHQCQYCHQYFSRKELTIDHVIPLSKGGRHSWDNVTTACTTCNNKKGSLSLREFGKNPLNPPTCPSWLPRPELARKSRKLPQSWLPYLEAVS